MSEERLKILKMLAEGKITPDEAEQLLDALNAGAEEEKPQEEPKRGEWKLPWDEPGWQWPWEKEGWKWPWEGQDLPWTKEDWKGHFKHVSDMFSSGTFGDMFKVPGNCRENNRPEDTPPNLSNTTFDNIST